MQVKTLVSAFALTAALTFSGAAFAQDQQMMVGDSPVSAEDLPAVEDRCAALMTASTNESITEDDSSIGSEGSESTDNPNKPSEDATGEASATIDSAENVNEVLNATTTIDLETITLDWCEEYNLGGAM